MAKKPGSASTTTTTFNSAKPATSGGSKPSLWDSLSGGGLGRVVGSVFGLVGSGAGDGSGGDVGGSGDGGGGYYPDPALLEALARLDGYEAQARGQIDSAEAQWRQRLAVLRAMQESENAAAMRTVTGDAANQLAAYNRALDPITADLQAQGFTAAPIQQQAELDRSRLSDYGQRQGDLSRRFAEIQNNTFADRDAAATGQMAGARSMLTNNIAQMRAELESQISGGGGGRSGSGGDAPLSILKALAEANSPLADPRSSINYTGRHAGMINAALGNVRDDLSNVGRVQRRFVREARAKDLNHGGFVRKAKNQVFKPLRKAAPGYQKSLAKKNVAAEYVRMWGQS